MGRWTLANISHNGWSLKVTDDDLSARHCAEVFRIPVSGTLGLGAYR